MINQQTSETIRHSLSHASLGARYHPTLAPRPLFDPMADHAIVLYDPTIDDRPSEEEIEAVKALLAQRKKDAEARGPHKSLKAILGIQDTDPKAEVKVPVVIDPRLAKTLRPHQIEGVKVSPQCSDRANDSSCIDVRLDLWMTKLGAVSWRTRWAWVGLLAYKRALKLTQRQEKLSSASRYYGHCSSSLQWPGSPLAKRPL